MVEDEDREVLGSEGNGSVMGETEGVSKSETGLGLGEASGTVMGALRARRGTGDGRFRPGEEAGGVSGVGETGDKPALGWKGDNL